LTAKRQSLGRDLGFRGKVFRLPGQHITQNQILWLQIFFLNVEDERS